MIRHPTREHIWRTSRGRTFCGRTAPRSNLASNLPYCKTCDRAFTANQPDAEIATPNSGR